MNKIKAIIFGWALAAVLPVFAADASATTKNDASPTKDVFISFVLDKAKVYTDKAEVAVSKAVDVVTTEAPRLVQEFLRWRLWMHGISTFLPVGLLILGFYLFFKHFGKWKMDAYGNHLVEGTPANVIATVLSGVLTLASLIISIAISLDHLMRFIQVLVAPRVYLVEEVIKVLK